MTEHEHEPEVAELPEPAVEPAVEQLTVAAAQEALTLVLEIAAILASMTYSGELKLIDPNAPAFLNAFNNDRQMEPLNMLKVIFDKTWLVHRRIGGDCTQDFEALAQFLAFRPAVTSSELTH
jgi:hypothetical protein